jgi:hypothetical protein
MKQTVFVKKFIKTVDDLSKDEKYHVHIIGNPQLRFLAFDSASFRQIKKRVDYYFQEVELPDEKEIEAWADKTADSASKFTDAFTRGEYVGIKEGAKWMRDKLLNNQDNGKR